jgi:hypothetical protein
MTAKGRAARACVLLCNEPQTCGQQSFRKNFHAPPSSVVYSHPVVQDCGREHSDGGDHTETTPRPHQRQAAAWTHRLHAISSSIPLFLQVGLTRRATTRSGPPHVLPTSPATPVLPNHTGQPIATGNNHQDLHAHRVAPGVPHFVEASAVLGHSLFASCCLKALELLGLHLTISF